MKPMIRKYLLLLATASASLVHADEYAILKSGSRLSAQKIEKQDDQSYRLTTATGVIILTEGDVVSIEKDDFIPRRSRPSPLLLPPSGLPRWSSLCPK